MTIKLIKSGPRTRGRTPEDWCDILDANGCDVMYDRGNPDVRQKKQYTVVFYFCWGVALGEGVTVNSALKVALHEARQYRKD